MDGARDGNVQRKPAALQRTSCRGLILGPKPLVVAAVHSAETLSAVPGLRGDPEAAPDVLELRLDCCTESLETLEGLASDAPRPLLVTVRRPDEGGGCAGLDDAARGRIYERFLPWAAGVDIEVRSLGALAAIVTSARRQGVKVVASFHDFQGRPEPARLRELAGQAADAGADGFKVAAMTRGPGDLAVLLDFLAQETRLPVAAMGMGPLGKASRVVLGAAGSVLNYGYLGLRAQVPGQWPARLLRERIDEVSGGRQEV